MPMPLRWRLLSPRSRGVGRSVVCLGDMVDYGPDPNEVTERVKALAPIIIRGNHDKAVAGLTDLEGFNPVAQIAAQWTREQHASPRNLTYIAELPAGPASADSLTLVHGSYQDEDEYVFVPSQAMERPAGIAQRGYIFRTHALPGRLFLSRGANRRHSAPARARTKICRAAPRAGNAVSAQSRFDRPAAGWRSARRVCDCRHGPSGH